MIIDLALLVLIVLSLIVLATTLGQSAARVPIAVGVVLAYLSVAAGLLGLTFAASFVIKVLTLL